MNETVFLIFAALGLCPTVVHYYIRLFDGELLGVRAIGAGFGIASVLGMVGSFLF